LDKDVRHPPQTDLRRGALSCPHGFPHRILRRWQTETPPAARRTAMDSQVIAAADYQRERWRNQLGWTRQIFRNGDEQDWDWRLSIAEIDDDARFSRFPGADRELTLLSGNGLHLRFDDGEVAVLVPPHERHRFAGERV